MRVEAYGSLLNSKQREKPPLKKGMMIELGKQERIGWKLSFDKRSRNNESEFYREAVLNFVRTCDQKDVYYTTVYQVDAVGYDAVMEREMGPTNAKRWKQHEKINGESYYRPTELDSDYGKTIIFIIPEEGRNRTPANKTDKYYNAVKAGIESYKDNRMKAKNLENLEKAVKESQKP
jgi:hypothetical protein